MASLDTAPTGPRIQERTDSGDRTPWMGILPVVIAGTWVIAIVAEVSGNAGALHHHALIEGGSPWWVALPAFLLSWQVMVAAMMLPASLPAVRRFAAGALLSGRPGRALGSFLAGYAAVWTAFGVSAFSGDVILHRTVDATPWLSDRPWLIEAGVLAIAGAYQFVPLKRRTLAACRHPATPRHTDRGAFGKGIGHALDCLGSSWACMLLMFATGFANVWWMAALTVAMTYETTGRHGPRALSMIGVVLLGLAAVAILTGSVPAFGAT